MGTPGHALIVGGSMAGLFAGLLLRRIGWKVSILERSAQGLEGRGAGIVTHQALNDALNLAGIDDLTGLGVKVPGRVVLASDGSVTARCDLPQVLTAWGRLYRMLIEGLPPSDYQVGRRLERFTQDAGGVTAHFAGGDSMSGDLLVGADGINSVVRAQFLPDVAPTYAGYVAWRGLVEEPDISAETRAALMERFGFCLPDGEQMLGYPVAGAGDTVTPGQRRYNFVWYRPADQERELPRLCTDTDGVCHEGSIPPNRIQPQVIAEMRAAADRLLAPQFAEIVARTRQPFLQAIYDLECPRLVEGRVAIMGDAAFVARPHVGMGVTKAAEDALGLAAALEKAGHDVPAALALYDADRQPCGAKVIAQARKLGAYMQAQIKTPEERAMAAAYRTPEAVMRETATADFLKAA